MHLHPLGPNLQLVGGELAGITGHTFLGAYRMRRIPLTLFRLVLRAHVDHLQARATGAANTVSFVEVVYQLVVLVLQLEYLSACRKVCMRAKGSVYVCLCMRVRVLVQCKVCVLVMSKMHNMRVYVL